MIKSRPILTFPNDREQQRREGAKLNWKFEKPLASLRLCCLLISCLLLALGEVGPRAFAQSTDDAALAGWLNAQTNIQTWEADFVQMRRLKTLTQPLTETGHVWFAAPNRFRWELGHPAKTIAVRDTGLLQVLYPRLKRVERYPLDGTQAGPWKDTLALLDAGFPRSRAEVESRFNILSQAAADQFHEIILQPKSAMSRRMMPQIKIAFDTTTFSLHSTELQFADGSTMENVFTNATLNPGIDDSRFRPKVEEDWKIVEPLKKIGK
jgi:outer membrane lipoprotein carrier protein